MSIANRSVALYDRIIIEDYYVDLLNHILSSNDMVAAELATYNWEALVDMWNDFWESLPDSGVIRRGPFFELCDLCTQD